MHHDLSVPLPRPDLSPKLMRLLSESFAAKTLEAYALAWRPVAALGGTTWSRNLASRGFGPP